MKKRERILLIVLVLMLIPVAYRYMDFDFGGGSKPAAQKKENVNPVDELARLSGMIPGGGKAPEFVVLTNWGRNIFGIVNTDAMTTKAPDSRFFLSGVMTSGLVRSAIINDEVVTEGMLIDNYIVESIHEDMVVLSRNERRLVLSLSQ